MQNNMREAEMCFDMARKAHTLTEPPSDPKGVVRALRALAVIYEQQVRHVSPHFAPSNVRLISRSVLMAYYCYRGGTTRR